MADLDRDGVRIHYEVAGSGPAILLTHGFAATSSMFAANATAMAQQHTVITWDLRGHGRSDYPSDPDEYSVPRCLDDMIAVLDAAGADRAILAGHSLGGYLSLELAVARPDRVAGLLLIDTGPGFRKDAPRGEWNAMAERFARGFEERGLAAIAKSEELRADAHRDASGLVHAARGMLVQHDARVVEALGSIAVDTLIVVGANDTPFLAGSQYMAAKIPSAALCVIDGAGHAPNVSHPQRFDEYVEAFLDRTRTP
jgi:pimeloyl-ACP methyl ester carboxylesterase